jgi:hypothetical protein
MKIGESIAFLIVIIWIFFIYYIDYMPCKYVPYVPVEKELDRCKNID